MVGLRDVSRLLSLDENVDLWIQRSKWLLIGHFFEDFCRFSPIVIEISDESVVISNKYRGLTPVSNGIFKFCANQAFLLHHAVLEVSTQSGELPFFGARVKLLRGHFQNLSTDFQKLSKYKVERFFDEIIYIVQRKFHRIRPWKRCSTLILSSLHINLIKSFSDKITIPNESRWISILEWKI